MRTMTHFEGRARLLTGLILGTAAAAFAAAPPARPDASRALASLPAWFEPNTGQYAPEVKYFSRRGAGALLVDAAGATFADGKGALRFEFTGGNPEVAVDGIEPMAATSSYLLGNQPERWKQRVPHYAKVRARGIYPGVDVAYYLTGTQLEYDLVIAPGADASRIRLRFAGAGTAKIDAEGSLVFANGMRQRRPVTYQETDSGRISVETRYRIGADGEVTLDIDRYDAARPLLVDPVLYAGYLGGDNREAAKAITLDRQGNVWVTGSSASTIAVPGQVPPYQDAPKGKSDVFVAKLVPDSAGNLTLAYWTVLGGSDDDEAEAIAVDDAGFVYLAGTTSSSDFPRGGTTLQSEFGGKSDAFVVKLRPDDSGTSSVWFSQWYGGSDVEVAYALAVDRAGAVYVAGYTLSGSLPSVSDKSLQCCNRGGYEGFLIKVLPDSTSPLAFASYFGGSSTDVITGLAVTPAGDVYIAGYTASTDFPLTGDAFQPTMNSSVDAFLVRLDLNRPGLDAIRYATYFGGNGLDVVRTLLLDGTGGLWAGGYTFSSDFPVTAGAYQSKNAGVTDLFLTRFDLAKLGTPNPITYSTYLGGADTDVLYGMTLAPGGRIALTGYTYSADFPRTGSPASAVGTAKVFVTLLDPAKAGAAALVESSTLGGKAIDAGTGIAADAAGRLFVSGFTNSFDFPVTDGSTKLSPGGATQSFVLEVKPNP